MCNTQEEFFFLIERREGKEKEGERNINVRKRYQSVDTHPDPGPNLQSRPVP